MIFKPILQGDKSAAGKWLSFAKKYARRLRNNMKLHISPARDVDLRFWKKNETVLVFIRAGKLLFPGFFGNIYDTDQPDVLPENTSEREAITIEDTDKQGIWVKPNDFRFKETSRAEDMPLGMQNWQGPLLPDGSREMLTWAGPYNRYGGPAYERFTADSALNIGSTRLLRFLAGFSPHDDKIFKDGVQYAVAPTDVFGAAIYIDSNGERFLIAAGSRVGDSANDILFSVWARKDGKSDTTAEYNATTDPDGWRLLGGSYDLRLVSTEGASEEWRRNQILGDARHNVYMNEDGNAGGMLLVKVGGGATLDNRTTGRIKFTITGDGIEGLSYDETVTYDSLNDRTFTSSSNKTDLEYNEDDCTQSDSFYTSSETFESEEDIIKKQTFAVEGDVDIIVNHVLNSTVDSSYSETPVSELITSGPDEGLLDCRLDGDDTQTNTRDDEVILDWGAKSFVLSSDVSTETTTTSYDAFAEESSGSFSSSRTTVDRKIIAADFRSNLILFYEEREVFEATTTNDNSVQTNTIKLWDDGVETTLLTLLSSDTDTPRTEPSMSAPLWSATDNSASDSTLEEDTDTYAGDPWDVFVFFTGNILDGITDEAWPDLYAFLTDADGNYLFYIEKPDDYYDIEASFDINEGLDHTYTHPRIYNTGVI